MVPRACVNESKTCVAIFVALSVLSVAYATAQAPPTPPQATPPPPTLATAQARDVLFPNAGIDAELDRCTALTNRDAAVDCMVTHRYAGDREAQGIALELRRQLGVVAGVEVPHTMNGGFRGLIQIVGELPVGVHRHHLAWVSAALHDFEHFFRELRTRAPRGLAYHPLPNALRFLRSVRRTTPSAYASDWRVSYNVSGSLLHNADSVRETLFHEIFHLNDEVHTAGTQRWWSERFLRRISDRIIARCGARRACLASYAPGSTTVRGGTYYAFQQNNNDSVFEYGAELALRYYQEQRAILRHERFGRAPFKCGPAENAEAWRLLSDEFFGGADLTPPCAR